MEEALILAITRLKLLTNEKLKTAQGGNPHPSSYAAYMRGKLAAYEEVIQEINQIADLQAALEDNSL